MMRFMLFAFTVVLSSPVFAGSYKVHFYKPMPELLSYQELAMLPKPTRVTYLKGIRQTLTDMQRMRRLAKKSPAKKVPGKKGKRVHAEVDPFEKRIEELLARFAFLPEASAVEAEAAEEPATVKPVLPFLKADGSIACANGERNYFYYSALGTCGHKRTGASCPAADDKPVKVTGADGRVTSYCVPSASWEGMPVENVTSLQAGKPVTLPRVADDTPADAATDPVDTAKVVANASSNSTSAYKEALVKYATDNGAGGTLYDTRSGELYNGATWVKPEEMTPEQVETFKKEGGHIGCAYDEKSFKRSDELRTKISESGIGNCVMGGMFSAYNSDGGVRKGNCENITKFPKYAEDGFLQCSNTSHQMCNPLLYCTKITKDAAVEPAPICLPKSEELTANCDAEMKKVETEAGIKCDPFDPKFKVPAVQNEWKNFMVDFNLLCNPKGAFVEFFCKECQLMSARVRAITVAAKGRRDAGGGKDDTGPGEFDHLLGTPDEKIPDATAPEAVK